MSERRILPENVNDSKNTRLGIVREFAMYRFTRDPLAHLSRYLFIMENLMHRWRRQRRRRLRVIDIGCGDIYVPKIQNRSDMEPIANVIERYVGLDIDEFSLERTKATMPEPLQGIVELVHGDVTTGALKQFEDNEFDALICTEVLEHIQPQFVPAVLCELRRIARYGYISTPNAAGGSGRMPADHVREWTYQEMVREMELAGIEIVRHIGVFSNLSRVKKVVQQRRDLQELFEFLQ